MFSIWDLNGYLSLMQPSIKWKLIPIASSVVALLVLAPAQAASIKSGATCAKKGATQVQSGKKYTCIIKGKKLVWDSGVKLPNAQPSASATAKTPSFQPWSTKFDYQDMVKAALANTAQYFGKVTPSDKFAEIVDPQIKVEDKTNVNKVLSYINGMFSNVSKKEVQVFLGATHEWGAATLRANNTWVGNPGSKFPCSDGSRDAMCAEGNKILLIYSDIYGGKGTFGWDYGRVSVPAHEYFHTIQATLSSENGIGNSNIQPTAQTLPVWLDEGSANFVGFFVTNQMQIVDYFYARNYQITNNQNYREVHPLSEYIGRGNTSDGTYFLDPYGIGQAATEYLVASVGFKPLIEIYANYKVTKNFPVAFKSAVGIEIEDFYAKFEAARGSMRITK